MTGSLEARLNYYADIELSDLISADRVSLDYASIPKDLRERLMSYDKAY